MQPTLWKQSICLLSVCAVSITAATFTVSKDGRGQFSTIQAAVDAAGRGDIVRILDNATYEERVDIDSTKAGLTLASANPSSHDKPTIVWQDREHVYPKTYNQSMYEDSINYDRNGALRLIRTRNVTVDGIRVEGGGVFSFGANGVWAGRHSLQHGNGAIAIFSSGDITIRNCEISDAYVGINVIDRNEGGIYTNANPADLMPWNVMPLSGFSRTGNHLFEHNRIHHNSFGMFFESIWDLGSTIRYNLFYENHHADETTASEAMGLTDDGTHHTGGALWFKDHLLSPLAIYNNTFWHNFLIFVGHWNAGAQHLVFNNIYSTPHTYWGEDPNFPNPFHKMDHAFVNRMKSCVYATQTRPPATTLVLETTLIDPETGDEIIADTTIEDIFRVLLMNDIPMSGIESEEQRLDVTAQLSTGDTTVTFTYNTFSPGALITDPFPAEANIRWLETDFTYSEESFELFKSTDPADPAFLEPDWDNPLVEQFILDRGWEEAGIRDADGSIADLGAISLGGHPTADVSIKPTAPVKIMGQAATIKFDIIDKEGGFSNPTVKYIRFIENLEFQIDAFGGSIDPIPADAIEEIEINQPVQIGSNELSISVPPRGEADLYAFFEMIVEGTGPDGQTVASPVGFLPYRFTDAYLNVTAYDDSDLTQEIDTVRVGEPFYIRLTAYDNSGSPFPYEVTPVDVSLNSGTPLLSGDCDIDLYQSCSEFSIRSLQTEYEGSAVITSVPEGVDYIRAAGIWINPENASEQLVFYGNSDAITVLPGEPTDVVFQNPPSNLNNVDPPTIDPGIPFEGTLEVYDRFGNCVDQPSQVQLNSLHPDIGNFVGGTQTITTDVDGIGHFTVEITNGAQDDIFTLQGAIQDMTPDQADVRVGAPTDRFWIYYGDTTQLDYTLRLEGETGQRLPIQIRVSNDGDSIVDVDDRISISATISSLSFYATEDAQESSELFEMSGGSVEVWVTADAPVNNAGIEVCAENNQIRSGYRESIYFTTDVSVQQPTRIRQRPYKLTVTAGPNPFVQGTPLPQKIFGRLGESISYTDGILMQIVPHPEPEQGVTLDVSATIYDAVGNAIASCGSSHSSGNMQPARDTFSSSVYLIWNGRDRQNRPVSPGTYAAFIMVRDQSGREEKFVTKIGVKEQ